MEIQNTSAVEPLWGVYSNVKSGLESLWDSVQSHFASYVSDPILTTLLKDHQWVFNPQGIATKVHFLAVKALSLGKTKLFDFQENLPSLPVPPLDESLDKFLSSVRPLLSEEEFLATKASAEAFRTSLGPQLQEGLEGYAKDKRNWLEQFWEELAYLRNRYPLPISSNWYGVDSLVEPKREYENPIIDRGSRVITLAMRYREMVVNQTLPPTKAQDTIPVCMHPFSRLFGTVRIPGKEVDRLVTVNDSRHIAVMCNHRIYQLDVFDEGGALYHEFEIRQQLAKIWKDAHEGEQPLDVSLLTSQNRTQWAHDREHLLKENEESVALIENALCVICLNDSEPGDMEELSQSVFRDYHNRWYDKGVQFQMYRNGMTGGHMEHTWADATIAAEMQRYIFAHEHDEIKEPEVIRDLPDPKKLSWKLDEYLQEQIGKAEQSIAPLTANIDLKVLPFMKYGKEFIKKLNMSPDAYIQMAIQWTYYKMYGQQTLTYETSSTRMFYHGRTETIRSVSMASKEMCEGLADAELDAEEKRNLIRGAVAQHTKTSKEAAVGKGCDRHLMGLKVLAKMHPQLKEMKLPLLDDEVFNLPFKVATSQTPCPNSAGGGFPPIAEDGYGVSYHVGKKHFYFHLTSLHMHPDTSTEKFKQNLEESLCEFYELFKDS